MKNKILIYGAGGYMGKLFTQFAKEKNLSVILASRDYFSTDDELRLFSIDETSVIDNHLFDIKLVVNLAGPFAFTQHAFIKACIETGTHYIDLSGEFPEFMSAFHFDSDAKSENITLMPGAGFGVVPTDVAAKLAQLLLPDATHLTLAYYTVGGATKGTLKTILKDINKEGIEIKNGKIIKAKPAYSDFHFSMNGKIKRVVYNPWRGDLFTATHSTNIPNIKTFSNFPGLVEKMMKGNLLWIRDLIMKRLLYFFPSGPSDKKLQKGYSYIYAEVKNEKGLIKNVKIKGPEAYVFTAQCLTNISLNIMNDNFISGFQVPSVYGKEILLENYQNVYID